MADQLGRRQRVFVQFPDFLMDKLDRFERSEFAVLLVVSRESDWRTHEARLTTAQIAEKARVHVKSVGRTLTKLATLGAVDVLNVGRGPGATNTIRVNFADNERFEKAALTSPILPEKGVPTLPIADERGAPAYRSSAPMLPFLPEKEAPTLRAISSNQTNYSDSSQRGDVLGGSSNTSNINIHRSEDRLGRSSKIDDLEMPAGLDCPEFREAWKQYQQHRRELSPAKGLTPSAARARLAECSTMGPERAIKAILHSIKNNWTGIFEPKHGRAQARHRDPADQYVQPDAEPIPVIRSTNSGGSQ